MKLSPAFRKELGRAIRLSVFITLLVVGILYAQGNRETETNITRRPSSTECFQDSNGKYYRYSRATPPYEKVPCR